MGEAPAAADPRACRGEDKIGSKDPVGGDQRDVHPLGNAQLFRLRRGRLKACRIHLAPHSPLVRQLVELRDGSKREP